jgi:hypothetical protein
MKTVFSNFLIPTVVGIGSLVLLEDGLLKLTNIDLREKVLQTEIKLIILFSAAYAANGTQILPAIIAIYIYYLITNQDYELRLEESLEKKEEKKE